MTSRPTPGQSISPLPTSPGRRLSTTSLALGALLIAACAGSSKDSAAPKAELAEPASNAAPNPVDTTTDKATGHLTIAPFVLRTTRTRQDGSTSVVFLRGTADGVISAEKDGAVRKDMLKVTSDGVFSIIGKDKDKIVTLHPDGTFTIPGSPTSTLRVSEDGALYNGDTLVLRIVNGKVIDVTGKMMRSEVTLNGKLTSRSGFEMTVEGGDEVKRLVMAILALHQLPTKRSQTSVHSTSGDASPRAPLGAVGPSPRPRPTSISCKRGERSVKRSATGVDIQVPVNFAKLPAKTNAKPSARCRRLPLKKGERYTDSCAIPRTTTPTPTPTPTR